MQMRSSRRDVRVLYKNHRPSSPPAQSVPPLDPPAPPAPPRENVGDDGSVNMTDKDEKVQDTQWIKKECSQTGLTIYQCSLVERPSLHQFAVDLMTAVRQSGLETKDAVYLCVAIEKGDNPSLAAVGAALTMCVNRFGTLADLCSPNGVKEWMELCAPEAAHCSMLIENSKRCADCRSGIKFYPLKAAKVILVHLQQKDGPTAFLKYPKCASHILYD
jgi:hypothetical protein